MLALCKPVIFLAQPCHNLSILLGTCGEPEDIPHVLTPTLSPQPQMLLLLHWECKSETSGERKSEEMKENSDLIIFPSTNKREEYIIKINIALTTIIAF